MNWFLKFGIIASAILAYVNFFYLCNIDSKLSEIKSEISKLKNQKGGAD